MITFLVMVEVFDCFERSKDNKNKAAMHAGSINGVRKI